jgi:hypothetical protein
VRGWRGGRGWKGAERTCLEVAEHNRDLGACDDQDEEYEGEESEDVVKALEPDRGHDKEELGSIRRRRMVRAREEKEIVRQGIGIKVRAGEPYHAWHPDA